MPIQITWKKTYSFKICNSGFKNDRFSVSINFWCTSEADFAASVRIYLHLWKTRVSFTEAKILTSTNKSFSAYLREKNLAQRFFQSTKGKTENKLDRTQILSGHFGAPIMCSASYKFLFSTWTCCKLINLWNNEIRSFPPWNFYHKMESLIKDLH